MIVVDTSAVLAALAGDPPMPHLLQRIGTDGDLHAPHLIDVELVHALRGLVARRTMARERAEAVRRDFAQLTFTRYPHHPFADRMWELRGNMSAYDAVFVALSEAVAAPLVTCDARLEAAHGHRAQIELFRAG